MCPNQEGVVPEVGVATKFRAADFSEETPVSKVWLRPCPSRLREAQVDITGWLEGSYTYCSYLQLNSAVIVTITLYQLDPWELVKSGEGLNNKARQQEVEPQVLGSNV